MLFYFPSLFLAFIKQLSSAMDAGGPRMSGDLYLMLFLPQDGLWDAISAPGWKQLREKGRRAAWKLQPLFLPSKPAGRRCQFGIKSSKLGSGQPKNGTVALKKHSGQAEQVSENSHSSSHRDMTQTKQGELEFSSHCGTIS